MSLVYVFRVEMTCSSAGWMMSGCCGKVIQALKGLTVICRIKPYASVPHLPFFSAESPLTGVFLFPYHNGRKAERQGK